MTFVHTSARVKCPQRAERPPPGSHRSEGVRRRLAEQADLSPRCGRPAPSSFRNGISWPVNFLLSAIHSRPDPLASGFATSSTPSECSKATAANPARARQLLSGPPPSGNKPRTESPWRSADGIHRPFDECCRRGARNRSRRTGCRGNKLPRPLPGAGRTSFLGPSPPRRRPNPHPIRFLNSFLASSQSPLRSNPASAGSSNTSSPRASIASVASAGCIRPADAPSTVSPPCSTSHRSSRRPSRPRGSGWTTWNLRTQHPATINLPPSTPSPDVRAVISR